ncbi:unnamed protein product (macronuclear) [Paramecium tetraurelia]|uniref:GDP-D-glucose phosphorylase 1 n=1 Tax=Paramecium tetraurelia TaxID=5888 RepID=A0ECB5_PARTE|nr:uncharacterized protein GSPATT00025669001 [Paramecium tetraurelia]CAK92932.1 unnamed protein product [Paramecium tetraurelia]|eukprot:XP_001460329.1 hypothetical protein (macronuclear) [Paramecium tetraurelia strain d4-2]
MIQKPCLEDTLKQKWSDKYEKSRDLFRSTLKFIHTKPILPFKAYFNLQLIENKVPTQIRDPETELIGEFNEDDVNFLNVEQKEILFRVDISTGEIVDDENNMNENNDNPILVNTAPICSYHSIVVPFLNSKFQQLLSGFIAESVFILFKISQSPHLRIGYNSKLANCSINHLHLHLIYVDQLFDNNRFPVEEFPIKPLATIKNATLGEVENYPIRTLVITGENIIELLSLTIDTLLAHEIPHNIMFVSPQLAYIFPRRNQFDFIHEHGMKPAYAELCGLMICRSKKYFEELTLQEIEAKLSELTHPLFDNVVQDLVMLSAE